MEPNLTKVTCKEVANVGLESSYDCRAQPWDPDLAGNKRYPGTLSPLSMPPSGQLCPCLTPIHSCPLGRAVASSEKP